MKKWTLPLWILLWSLTACIQDDILDDAVPENLRLTNVIDTIPLNSSYQFEARFTNRIGEVEDRAINWWTDQPDILQVSTSGEALATSEGSTTLRASVEGTLGETIETQHEITVVADGTINPTDEERTGTIQTTSSYVLEGSFTVREINGVLTIDIADDYKASSSLPGLYLYLTNNPNSTANALEVGEVSVFSGAHEYQVSGTDLNDYDYLLYFCKPFSVKVGDGALKP